MQAMKQTGELSTYNRTLARAMVAKSQLGESLLAYFGAGEAKLLVALVAWADADRTTYE